MKSLYLILLSGIFVFLSAQAQETGNFFFDDWAPKNISSPVYLSTEQSIGATPALVNIDFDDTIAFVSKYVYGNNANPYSGRMNLDAVLLQHLNNLQPHVIRWPGGNISQEYYWNHTSKPTDIPSDAGFWSGFINWGQTNADYYDLLQKTNSTGIICVNIGYARLGTSADPVAKAAKYAADWVRYDNGRTKFWELGNENYGSWVAGYRINTALNQDGQPEYISGDLYGEICKVFIDSMRAAAAGIGHEIRIGAVALEAPITWDAIQGSWNQQMMPHLADVADFFIVHSYYTPYNENSSVETILNSPVITPAFESHIRSGLAAIGRSPMPVALTEWNIFAVGSQQAVSYINGMHSALTLGELIKHQYGLAAKWDLSNGWSDGDDHGMFASQEEPGATYRMPHPQFHYMYYFQKFFGDRMIGSEVTGNPNVIAYASAFESGHSGIVVANKSRYPENAELRFSNFDPGNRYYVYTLTGGTGDGDFSRRVFINGQGPAGVAGGPANYASIKPDGYSGTNGLKLSLPPLSMAYVLVNPKGIPDIVSAKIEDDPAVIKVQLTCPVLNPDSVEGFSVTGNGEMLDILSIETEASDSSVLLIFLSNPMAYTDTIKLSYSPGNIYSGDSIPMIAMDAMDVENLLSGSAPQLVKGETDNQGTTVLLFFNKKMDPPPADNLILSISYNGTREAAIVSEGYYENDSSVYALVTDEPFFYDYTIMVSYSGNEITATDGGILAGFNNYIIRNYAPIKPADIQQAFTNILGDSIMIQFDKDLLPASGLLSAFTVKADGAPVALRTVSRSDSDPGILIIRPIVNISRSVSEILISYSGDMLLSYDNVSANEFSDFPAENLSGYTSVSTDEGKGFVLYPNPASDHIIINADFLYTAIEMIDMTGRKVYSEVNPAGFPHVNHVNIGLQRGIYILILRTKELSVSAKLIIE